MALTMWGQVIIQSATPGEDPVKVGTLWIDTSSGATLKICTSISPYTFSAITGGGLSDGDYGDITVGGTGTTLTIDNNAVSDAKLRDSGALSVVGRSANSSGDPADISATPASDAVLRESGSVLGFGTVATAGIANGAVTEAKQTLADNTTNDVSTTKHGYVPKAPNDTTKFLRGDASWAVPASGGGMQHIIFTAMANVGPATNFATLDTRNNHPVLDFDDTTDEDAIFGAVLPSTYAATGLSIDIYWTATTATTGDVVWLAAIERMNTDIDADSFAATQTATSTTNGTSGILTKTTITFTDGAQMDSLAAGEAFRLKITRDANAAGDTLVGDAEVLRVVVRPT